MGCWVGSVLHLVSKKWAGFRDPGQLLLADPVQRNQLEKGLAEAVPWCTRLSNASEASHQKPVRWPFLDKQ